MLNIHMLQDDPDSAFLAESCLRRSGIQFKLIHAPDCKSFIDQARGHTDINLVILDLNLPDGHGVEAWRQAYENHLNRPTLWVSSQMNREKVTQSLAPLGITYRVINLFDARDKLPQLLAPLY